MMVFLIISTIAGMMIGLRFKVFVLGPATLLATAAATVTGIGSSHEAKTIALTAFGTMASLQIGYFAGRILLPWFLRTYRHGPDTLTSPPVGPGKILISRP